MTAYRLLLSVAWPALAVLALWRGLWRREGLRSVAERLGWPQPPAEALPRIWIHAASNGELTSARPLIEALQDALPRAGLLITTNSVTGRALAESWAEPRIEARLAPFDLPRATTRLIRRFDVCGHLVIESEFWPNRIAALAARGLPVAAAGARMSARSARAWQRFPGLARATFGALDYVMPQDAGSAGRLGALGVRAEATGPVLQLKSLYRKRNLPVPAALARLFPREVTWLAASTHEGEEEAVIAAHLLARARRPELKLVIAPRHPRRADEVEALITRQGLSVARWSAGEPAGPVDVLLADTLGEMDRWYAAAAIVFVGGSLVDRGGHTPFEPMAHGDAVIHGPHVANFSEIYGRLDGAGGALRVADAEMLAGAVLSLLDADRRNALVARAARIEGGADAFPDMLERLASLYRKSCQV